jgi:hypothetical protein
MVRLLVEGVVLELFLGLAEAESAKPPATSMAVAHMALRDIPSVVTACPVA